jgi:predicted MarR family transcription regulator
MSSLPLAQEQDSAAETPEAKADALVCRISVCCVKSLAKEGLVSEHKAKSGRAIQVQLTAKGNQYRERLIEVRETADESVRRQMTSEERETLLRLLKLVAECEF